MLTMQMYCAETTANDGDGIRDPSCSPTASSPDDIHEGNEGAAVGSEGQVRFDPVVAYQPSSAQRQPGDRHPGCASDRVTQAPPRRYGWLRLSGLIVMARQTSFSRLSMDGLSWYRVSCR